MIVRTGKWAWAGAAIVASLMAASALADEDDHHDRDESYAIGLWGDLPYDNQGNGTNDVNWVKVTVAPRSREVFSYQAQIVPANRTAVPAPY